jgi:hypothetical protein
MRAGNPVVVDAAWQSAILLKRTRRELAESALVSPETFMAHRSIKIMLQQNLERSDVPYRFSSVVGKRFDF